jgi:hypothetical protein
VNWFTKTKKSNDTPWAEQPLRFRMYVNMLEYGRRLSVLWELHKVGITLVAVALVGMYLLSACLTDAVEPTDVVEPDDLADLAEGYCKANPTWPCGHVYVCETPSTNEENDVGGIEVCLLDALPVTVLEDLYGPCKPTPRHVGLCWVSCGPNATPGCNAYDGCYCPPPPPEPMPDAGVPGEPHEPPKY